MICIVDKICTKLIYPERERRSEAKLTQLHFFALFIVCKLFLLTYKLEKRRSKEEYETVESTTNITYKIGIFSFLN